MGRALRNKWVVMALYLLGVVALIVGLLAAARALDLGTGEFAAVHTGLMLVVMAGALAVCLYWWRRTDEAAREAHKWSFFWGATCGIAVLGVALPPLLPGGGLVRLARGFDFDGETGLVLFGLLLALIVQLVGYTIAWAVWWLKRR